MPRPVLISIYLAFVLCSLYSAAIANQDEDINCDKEAARACAKEMLDNNTYVCNNISDVWYDMDLCRLKVEGCTWRSDSSAYDFDVDDLGITYFRDYCLPGCNETDLNALANVVIPQCLRALDNTSIEDPCSVFKDAYDCIQIAVGDCEAPSLEQIVDSSYQLLYDISKQCNNDSVTKNKFEYGNDNDFVYDKDLCTWRSGRITCAAKDVEALGDICRNVTYSLTDLQSCVSPFIQPNCTHTNRELLDIARHYRDATDNDHWNLNTIRKLLYSGCGRYNCGFYDSWTPFMDHVIIDYRHGCVFTDAVADEQQCIVAQKALGCVKTVDHCNDSAILDGISRNVIAVMEIPNLCLNNAPILVNNSASELNIADNTDCSTGLDYNICFLSLKGIVDNFSVYSQHDATVTIDDICRDFTTDAAMLGRQCVQDFRDTCPYYTSPTSSVPNPVELFATLDQLSYICNIDCPNKQGLFDQFRRCADGATKFNNPEDGKMCRALKKNYACVKDALDSCPELMNAWYDVEEVKLTLDTCEMYYTTTTSYIANDASVLSGGSLLIFFYILSLQLF